MIGVYKITNIKNGNFYVGKSKNIERRFYLHFWDNNRKQKRSHSELFAREIEEYGRDNFSIEVLEECDETNLLERERYYIDLLDPQYNSVKRTRDEAFRKRVSDGTRKWWNKLPDSKKNQIIKNNLTHRLQAGHEVSVITRAKISRSLAGKKQSAETRQKRSESLKNVLKTKNRAPTYGNRKKVFAKYPDGSVKVFDSAISASREIGCSDKYIYRLIKSKRKFNGIDIWYEV